MPTETTYNYTISTQTANAAVAPLKLQEEIENSAIVTGLKKPSGIGYGGDTLNITFKDALSTGDEVILTSVVAAHDGVALPPVQALVTKIHEQDLDPVKQVAGHFRAKGFEMDIPATAGPHNLDITFPIDIAMLSMEFTPKPEMDGDYFCVLVGLHTVIGTITSDVSVSDTVLNVSQTVIDNAFLGVHILLDDGTNTSECAQVTAIDPALGTITVETASDQAYLVSTPTFVKMTAVAVEDVHLDGGARVEIGHSKIGGSFFPKGYTMRVVYHNITETAKKFRAVLEYLY